MKGKLEYIKVYAEYEADDMPVLYFYEIDLADERLALRAIEIYANRMVESIDHLYRAVIEIVPIPTAGEFNSKIWGGGFQASVVSKEEFEKIWKSSSYDGELSVV